MARRSWQREAPRAPSPVEPVDNEALSELVADALERGRIVVVGPRGNDFCVLHPLGSAQADQVRRQIEIERSQPEREAKWQALLDEFRQTRRDRSA